MTSANRDFFIELNLPFVTIGTSSVRSLFRRRRSDTAGPFLLLSVSSGLALDTGFGTAQGTLPHLWGPHGKPHQLWYLSPSGHEGEVHIVSAANRLLLDGGQGSGNGQEPGLWADNGGAWQRWRLRPSPDRRAHILACVGTGTVLSSPWDAAASTRPLMWEDNGGENQHWVLALPFGTAPD